MASANMLNNNIKLNVVIPGVVTKDSNIPMGNAHVNGTELAKVYLKVLENNRNGEIIKAWNLEMNRTMHRALMD